MNHISRNLKCTTWRFFELFLFNLVEKTSSSIYSGTNFLLQDPFRTSGLSWEYRWADRYFWSIWQQSIGYTQEIILPKCYIVCCSRTSFQDFWCEFVQRLILVSYFFLICAVLILARIRLNIEDIRVFWQQSCYTGSIAKSLNFLKLVIVIYFSWSCMVTWYLQSSSW